ncbi:hypothetical protein D3C72_2598310 [compost metagenome]
MLAALGKLEALELCYLVGQFLDHRSVTVDLLAHRLNGLTQRVDLMIECLDAQHQLRRQSTQLFRV